MTGKRNCKASCLTMNPLISITVMRLAYSVKTTTDRSLLLPGDDGHGNKKFEDRVTVLLCCSMVLVKLKPWVIGKSSSLERGKQDGNGCSLCQSSKSVDDM